MNARGRLVDMNGRTLVVMRGLLLPVSAVFYCLLAVDEVCIIWSYPCLLPLALTLAICYNTYRQYSIIPGDMAQ